MCGRLSEHFLPAMQRRYVQLEVEAVGMGAAGVIPEPTVPQPSPVEQHGSRLDSVRPEARHAKTGQFLIGIRFTLFGRRSVVKAFGRKAARLHSNLQQHTHRERDREINKASLL
jgi:hypothetical protein